MRIILLFILTFFSGVMHSQEHDDLYYIPVKKDTRIEFEKGIATDDLLLLKRVTQRGNSVYIESMDEGVIHHATYYLRQWGYWMVVDDKKDADFILRFSWTFGVINTDAFAEFIDVNDNKVLKITDPLHGVIWDMNTKRGVIKLLINKRIRPNFDV